VVGPVDKERWLSVRFDVPCAVIPADSAVCLRNVRLTVWHCIVYGMLRLTHSEVVAEQVVVAGRGAFFTEDCAVRGSADDTLLVAQHRATATVRRSSLRCPPSGKEGSRSVPFLLTLNCSVLTLEDCVVEASCRDVGLRALVASSVSLQRCVIRAGSSAVRSIGGAVSGVESTFTGGIVGEQQSIVELRSCTVDGATRGFTVTGSSRLTLEQCTASGTTAVGCLVDGAVATIRGSLLTGTEASLRVVNKSKCIATQLVVEPVKGKTLMHGVEVRDASTLVIKDSDIRNVASVGMFVVDNGSVDAEDLRIDGCTKAPGDESRGLRLENAGVCSVRRTTVRGYRCGIICVRCARSALTIEDCACDESYVGLWLYGCSDASVVRCRARSSEAGLSVLKSKCIATQLVVEPVEGKTLKHGVEVRDGATLVIKDSDIRNVASVGMFVVDNGSLDAEDLRIDGCTKPPGSPWGVWVENAGVCSVRRATVRGYRCGIGGLRCGSGTLTIEDCACDESYVGYQLDGCSDASVVRCRARSSGAGLLVLNKSKCTASQLLVEPVEGKTLMHGVEVGDGATLVIKDSDIRNADSVGMLVVDNGSLDAEDLRIDGCTKPPGDGSPWGVWVENAGVCSVRRTTVRGFRCGIGGLRCARGTLTIEDCACDESYVGLYLDGCSDVSVVRCRARSSETGLSVLNKSKCIATQLVVEPVEGKTLMHGVKVGDGATLVIKDSDIRNGEEVPMFVENGGVVEEDELRIDGCAKREVL
jgi:hypothetical protein